jgi:hypothetical protein
LPYLIKRHGDEALVEDLSDFWKPFPSPSLMVIKENGIIIAGSIVRKSDDLFYLMRLGLLNGNDEYKRHGAIGAMYYFSILERSEDELSVSGCGRHTTISKQRPD